MCVTCESHVQVTVTSGGMLVVKLDPNDLQFEHFTNFDGTFAYAQNKVHTYICTYIHTYIHICSVSKLS